MSNMKTFAMLLDKHDLSFDAATEIVNGYYNQFASIFNQPFPVGHASEILERHLNCRSRVTVMHWMRRQYHRVNVNT